MIIPEQNSSASGKVTPPSFSNHHDNGEEGKTNSEATHVTSPILTTTSNLPSTTNQSAQTRSVRFDRRRPQTLELRRESSRSYIGNCAEVDTYLL